MYSEEQIQKSNKKFLSLVKKNVTCINDNDMAIIALGLEKGDNESVAERFIFQAYKKIGFGKRSEIEILSVLLHDNFKNGFCIHRIKDFKYLTGLSEVTIKKVLKKLKDTNYLTSYHITFFYGENFDHCQRTVRILNKKILRHFAEFPIPIGMEFRE